MSDHAKPAASSDADDLTDYYRQAASNKYCGSSGTYSDGDIEVDEDAEVSKSDEGAFVKAWVWVPKPDTQH